MNQPKCLSCEDSSLIFVFGSNGAGIHGAGAAKHAYERHGAIMGQGHGLQGSSYAINTMSGIGFLACRVETFLEFADSMPEMRFFVTAIGTGLAGYSEEQIKPLFRHAPKNCILPKGWALPYRACCDDRAAYNSEHLSSCTREGYEV